MVLTAAAEDGVVVDGKPLTGEVRLGADRGPIDDSRVARGERRLVVLRREGLWAVRDFDPGSPARHAFSTIEATPVRPPLDAARDLPSVRRPDRTGGQRGRGRARSRARRGARLHGRRPGDTLQVAVEPDGSLSAVFADVTSGNSSYRFRFLRPGAPAEDGSVSVDFNRALLPPCAFADHFICPFPPPGNTLTVAVEAGERNRIDA
ncbi:hypothetical protein SBADM41S_07698 [Streptomyces badius]